MSFPLLQSAVNGLLKEVPRNLPVVVYSGVWTLMDSYPSPRANLPKSVLECLLEELGSERTILMPCYTPGFKDSFINLDIEPSTTGMVNELFRNLSDSKRTASAFFSFAARGPAADDLASLRPQDAWGTGSVFEWIEQKNAFLLMIGVPWPMCSFLHRAEWLVQVPYRYLKEFSGEMVLSKKKEPLKERLYVRSLDPLVENRWPNLPDLLQAQGMKTSNVGRGQVAGISACSLLKAVVPVLRQNPFAFIRDPELIKSQLHSRYPSRLL